MPGAGRVLPCILKWVSPCDDKCYTARVSDLLVLQVGAPMKAHWTDLLAPTHFWDDGQTAAEHARGALHLSIAKQLYNAPSKKKLVDQAMKSAISNEVLEIKSGVGPEAVVVAEKWATDLEAEVKHLRAKAECLKATLEDAE
ncbi:hypothetical protein B296_00043938 [Ensete ventricosum]|uniref:Uncharacterized protein n=1 Tax=Ensete ventricosum TaxID=4639 RepID=A0A426ZCP0_ENSVE|nr:hypothetical protein B296_00043938 [Ensete ventricosum]